MKVAFWLFVVMFLFVATARAEGIDTCHEDGNQVQMNACASMRFTGADVKMNKLYQEKMAHLQSAVSKGQLKDAQKAWLLYRDKSCLYESWPVHGGSMEPMVDNICLATMTEQRIDILQSYMTCTEPPCPN